MRDMLKLISKARLVVNIIDASKLGLPSPLPQEEGFLELGLSFHCSCLWNSLFLICQNTVKQGVQFSFFLQLFKSEYTILILILIHFLTCENAVYFCSGDC